jgi:hypothetical protein
MKTKQTKGKLCTPTDPLMLKVIGHFYARQAEGQKPGQARYVFLTNRQLNPDLHEVKSAVQNGTVASSAGVEALFKNLEKYLQKEAENKHKETILRREVFDEMLSSTLLLEFLSAEVVKVNVLAKLQSFGREDILPAHAELLEHFMRLSQFLN